MDLKLWFEMRLQKNSQFKSHLRLQCEAILIVYKCCISVLRLNVLSMIYDSCIWQADRLGKKRKKQNKPIFLFRPPRAAQDITWRLGLPAARSIILWFSCTPKHTHKLGHMHAMDSKTGIYNWKASKKLTGHMETLRFYKSAGTCRSTSLQVFFFSFQFLTQ